jgi:uncharacterized membrane protein YedE/YeeE
MKMLISFLSGLVFGLGLLISGMNDPQKVRGFLDIFGAWQPELIAVMGMAVVVFFVAYRFGLTRKQPVFSDVFHTPVLTQINIRLVMGAVLFGVGWGLVGLCPGPALVDVFSFDASVMWFVAAMLVGNRLAHYFVGPTK